MREYRKVSRMEYRREGVQAERERVQEGVQEGVQEEGGTGGREGGREYRKEGVQEVV